MKERKFESQTDLFFDSESRESEGEENSSEVSHAAGTVKASIAYLAITFLVLAVSLLSSSQKSKFDIEKSLRGEAANVGVEQVQNAYFKAELKDVFKNKAPSHPTLSTVISSLKNASINARGDGICVAQGYAALTYVDIDQKQPTLGPASLIGSVGSTPIEDMSC